MNQQEQQARALNVFPSDRVSQYNDIAQDFFRSILEMDSNQVLVTDASQLYDFSFAGNYLSDEAVNDPNVDVQVLYAQWNEAVVQAIEARYGLRVQDCGVTMVELFEQLHRLRTRVLH